MSLARCGADKSLLHIPAKDMRALLKLAEKTRDKAYWANPYTRELSLIHRWSAELTSGIETLMYESQQDRRRSRKTRTATYDMATEVEVETEKQQDDCGHQGADDCYGQCAWNRHDDDLCRDVEREGLGLSCGVSSGNCRCMCHEVVPVDSYVATLESCGNAENGTCTEPDHDLCQMHRQEHSFTAVRIAERFEKTLEVGL
jgi:hypothetical protein